MVKYFHVTHRWNTNTPTEREPESNGNKDKFPITKISKAVSLSTHAFQCNI